MSNRMGVLSRRLERFAVGFSVATFSFFLFGLFSIANNKGQVVFVVAGLASVCLFATFFLWVAHGFAWALIPEKPAEAKKPVEVMKPAESTRPEDAKRAAEALKPVAQVKPAETMKPAEPIRTEDVKRATEAPKPAAEMKPAETTKPVEEKVIAPVDPPDAKYTITGKRIY